MLLSLAVETVYNSARFIAFQHVVQVVNVPVEHLWTAFRITPNHLIVWVACPYQYLHHRIL